MYRFILSLFVLLASNLLSNAEENAIDYYVIPEGSPMSFKEKHKVSGFLYFHEQAEINVE